MKQCPESDIGPFLKEEEKLLYSIAERVGRIIERKNAENELLAFNQQLTASEQQLRATNQQVTASEQQLRAANQQLTASEQQLRAANQQLTASEQQLRAANQQLTASELRYSLLFNNMNAGFALHEMLYDTNGNPCDYRFLQVNPAFERMTGLKADRIIGKTVKEILPDTESYWIETYAEVAQTGKSDTYENYAKELDKHFNVLAFSPKKDFFAVAVLDVTKRKKAEEKLELALAKAQESDRLKSAFLANMSHEIRTPMNGILGFIDLLNTPGLEDTKKHEFTKIIHKSSKRLLDTINELIDISTIEASQIKIINSDVCINKLLDELYVFFTPETKSKSLSLTFLPSHDKLQTTIFTDAHKLNGVLTNIIKNAIKYTDAGSITYGYVLKDDFVEFYVEDTGIGIATDRQGAIFDRFVQADIGNARAFEGLGLGLSISKAYIEAMNGQIWVKSEEGNGSKFMFTIPYKSKREKQLEPDLEYGEELYAEDICKNMNILIVDDDDVVALYYAESLKNKFRKILYAADGKEAIEMFKSNPEIDLILMDAKMPVMDGYKATREIRKFNKGVIIIAQTAYALKGDREKMRQAGCNDYISKPIDVKKLMRMIELLIKKKNSHCTNFRSKKTQK